MIDMVIKKLCFDILMPVFYEIEHSINHLRVFFCLTWYLIPASSTNKLDKQGKFSMLLYYLKDEMGYVV